MSRIGFDASGSQALLYVSYSCGSLCGYDYFVLVEHRSDGWHAVNYGSIPFLAIATGATLWLMWLRRARRQPA